MPLLDDVQRVWRDFVRYTGDGQPNAPVGHPLASGGDPRSGVHNPSKGDIRDLLIAILQAMGDPGALDGIISQLNGKVDKSTSNFAVSHDPVRRYDGRMFFAERPAVGGGTTVGWQRIPVKTPAGMRYVAARTPAFLTDGSILYINLQTPYSGEYPVVEAIGTPALYDSERAGNIIVLLQTLAGTIAGELAPAITRELDLARPVERMSYHGAGAAEAHCNGRSWDTSRPPLNINSTGWWVCQPAEDAMIYRILQGSATVDLTWLPPGREALIDAPAGCAVYAGDGGAFIGQGASNRASFAGASVFRVARFGGANAMIEPIVGTPTFGTITRPAMGRTILLGGQSQNHMGAGIGAIGGFSDEMATPGLSGTIDATSTFWINAAKSGSAIDRSSTTNDDYWWDTAAGAPGPLLTAAIAAINAATAAGQPLPALLIWKQGEDDAREIDQGIFTKGFYKAAVQAVFTRLRTAAPAMRVMVCPPGSNDTPYFFRGMMGIRETYRELSEELAWVHYGSEMYDVPRNHGNVHPTDAGYYIMGIRDALMADGILNGSAVNRGPYIQSAVKQADGTIKVTIRSDDFFPWPAGEDVGPNPYGLCVISGDPSVNLPIPMMRGAATRIGVGPGLTNEVILVPARDVTGARVYTIPGQFGEVWKRTYFRDTRQHGRSPGVPIGYQRSAPL